MGQFVKNFGIFIVAAVVLYFGFSAVSDKITISLDMINAPSEAGSSTDSDIPLTAPIDPGSPLNAPNNPRGGAGGEVISATGLKYKDDVVGTGATAISGKQVSVHYTGTLTNGKKFDSSRDRGEPFIFLLGAGQVIKGWDEGVVGMKIGGKRRLIIPSELAYGDRALPGIPANSTLLFDVELLAVK